jgi:hypothetical protein
VGRCRVTARDRRDLILSTIVLALFIVAWLVVAVFISP